MITLKSGYTYTYAVTEKVNSDVSEEYKSDDQRKSQQKNTTEQSYVMVEDGGSPLVTALNEPEIKGVVVVCAGGGAPKVVAQVTAAVKTALDISSAKITVSKISPGAAGH
jgi:stage III sporulation protein AG